MKELLQQKAEALYELTTIDEMNQRIMVARLAFVKGAKEILDNPELYGWVKKENYDGMLFDAHIGIGVDGTNHLRDYHSVLCSNCRGLMSAVNFKIADNEYKIFEKILVAKNTEEKENKELKEKVTELEGVIAKLSQKVILYKSNY